MYAIINIKKGNTMKNMKSQKGYALLLMMAFSVLSLSLVSTTFIINNNKQSESIKENLITNTARQTVDFSLATSKKLSGIGAIPGEKIGVDDLKNDGLLNDGFPDSIAFGQDIVSYYVTSPDNNNVIDSLTMIEGVPDESYTKSMGLSEKVVGRFFNQVISRGLTIGYPSEKTSDEFHVGIVTNNGNTLKTSSGEIDISHVPKNFTGDTFGIYSTAPNQTGYWRFSLLPYISRSTPLPRIIEFDSGNQIRSRNTSLSHKNIVNEGFTYFCPDNYIKIPRNEEFSHHIQNMNTSDAINICIETYKGSVNDSLKNNTYVQVINPLGPDSPEPISKEPSIWGYCGIQAVYYEDRGKKYPELVYICGNEQNAYSIVNDNNIIGIANNVKLQSWQNLNKNKKMRQVYDMSFKNLYDYDISNMMIASSIHFNLDGKNVKLYIYAGRLLTGEDGNFNNSHNNNFLYGAGVDISHDALDAVTRINDTYKDDKGNTRNIIVNIPTSRK